MDRDLIFGKTPLVALSILGGVIYICPTLVTGVEIRSEIDTLDTNPRVGLYLLFKTKDREDVKVYVRENTLKEMQAFDAYIWCNDKSFSESLAENLPTALDFMWETALRSVEDTSKGLKVVWCAKGDVFLSAADLRMNKEKGIQGFPKEVLYV